MSYQIKFNKKSLKTFLKMPKTSQNAIISKLTLLAENPYAVNNNIKKLQGLKDSYRLRLGDYRILYRLINKQLIIEVINIAHRREAYR